MNDPRVFQTGQSTGVDPTTLARLVARAETLAECHRLACAHERVNHSVGMVRIILGGWLEDAWLQVEAVREGATVETERGPDEKPCQATPGDTAVPGVVPRSVSSVPLDETPQPGRASSGVSSSGATGTDGMPSVPLPEGTAPLDSHAERELWLIARGYDMALRALGVREPQSLKADAKPKLRVVE